MSNSYLVYRVLNNILIENKHLSGVERYALKEAKYKIVELELIKNRLKQG